MIFQIEYFKRRIQELRHEKGHTYDTIAKGTRLTSAGVHLMLNGERNPSMDTFVRICEFYNQPPEIFFNRHRSSIK